MFDQRTRHVPVQALAVVAGLLGLAGLAGCSNGGSTATGGMTGITVSNGSRMYTAPQLRKALLIKVNGYTPSTESGRYAQLPEIKAATTQMDKVTVSPGQCRQAIELQGGDLAADGLGAAPAAVASFRIQANEVTEMLISPASVTAAADLGKGIPAGCKQYSVSMGGHTYQYAAHQAWVGGMGSQPARLLDISVLGQKASASAWWAVFHGPGFVGVLSVTGPGATEGNLRTLGKQAYEYAAKKLS